MYRLVFLAMLAQVCLLGQVTCGTRACSERERLIFNLNLDCSVCPLPVTVLGDFETCYEMATELRKGHDAICDALDLIGADCGSYSDYLDQISALLSPCEQCQRE